MNNVFCLDKTIFKINDSPISFLNNYRDIVELPILEHPGSFGYVRKNHIHEGIDFYCEDGDAVYALEDGVVILIKNFTGESVGSPWWNETEMILIRHEHFCINYGEIIVDKKINPGDKISKGDFLGNVNRVLKKDKGRPMAMLHIEMYEKEVFSNIDCWALNEKKPIELLNPTDYFLNKFFI